jgi:predicted heme/steroid binding protein
MLSGLSSVKLIAQICNKIMDSELPVFTNSQLALRNGQDKPEVWVAYKGMIYDVTLSRLWRKGMHYEHWAGQDLTHELKDAPHTEKVFEKFKCVGKLADKHPQ